ncbi:MAG TPA: hypothetical protein VG454_04725 [Gemmatimonadales bacterium]|nr:hypothetical protein [Gemmatimonadales bacterium]
MDGQTASRPDGLLRKLTMSATVFLLAVGLSGRPAVGQVGHNPASSPYHDILLRSGPSIFAGHLSGDRGSADAGFSNGDAIGLRYELPAGKTLVVQFNGTYVKGDRFIINPAADSSSPQRKTGPYPAEIFITDLMLQLRLTGAKSWHRIAPYAGAGIGLGFETKAPPDTIKSGTYKFGTKFILSGATGVRIYPLRRISLNGDARFALWKESYPTSFHQTASDGSRVLPLLHDLSEWTFHPILSVGVGWTF